MKHLIDCFILPAYLGIDFLTTITDKFEAISIRTWTFLAIFGQIHLDFMNMCVYIIKSFLPCACTFLASVLLLSIQVIYLIFKSLQCAREKIYHVTLGRLSP